MDGTLLNSKGKVSTENADSILAAAKAGIKVTIATGRMFSSVQKYAKELALDIPLVVYNGALIKDSFSGEETGAWPVEVNVANQITSFCRANDIYVQAYVNDNLWVREDCEFARIYAGFADVNFQVQGDNLFSLPQAPHKLLVMTENGSCDKVQAKLEAVFGKLVHITNSQKDFLEIVALNTSKWKAIKSMGEKLRIKPEEIMCIGDSNNDAEMITSAGMGVAMGNANDNIKSLAKIITGTNDDNGVAMIINSILTKQAFVPDNI